MFSRTLLEVSALQFYRELTFGCYFKLTGGSHFFVSSTFVHHSIANPFIFPLIVCEPESAVQNDGEKLIVAPGETMHVLGEFKFDDNAGIQLKGGKVNHYQPLTVEEYEQLLVVLNDASSSSKYAVEVRMILLMRSFVVYKTDLFVCRCGNRSRYMHL